MTEPAMVWEGGEAEPARRVAAEPQQSGQSGLQCPVPEFRTLACPVFWPAVPLQPARSCGTLEFGSVARLGSLAGSR